MFEKVNPAHPDKIADRIAGALVDLAYTQEKNPKIAVEVLIGHGMCHVIAETSVHLSVEDIRQAVQRIAGEGVVLNYHEVRQDPILSGNQQDGLRCGDNGIFKGVPVTVEQHMLADIARDLYSVFPTDGKYIIDGLDLIVCQSNAQRKSILHFFPNAMEVGSLRLCRILADLYAWDLDASYRVPGTIIQRKNIAMFYLDKAEVIEHDEMFMYTE